MNLSTIVKSFSRLIDENTTCPALYNEVSEDETCKQPKKIQKLTHANDVTTQLVIEKFMQKSTNKNLVDKVALKNFLYDELRNISSLHNKGLPYSIEKKRVISLMKNVSAMQIFSENQFLQIIPSSKLDFLPLDLLWHLSEMKLLSLEQVLNRLIENSDYRNKLTNDALALILRNLPEDNAENILQHFYIVLITLTYELKTKYESLQRLSRELLLEILHKFLESIPQSSKNLEENEKSSESVVEKCIDIYDLLKNNKILSPKTLKIFLTNQLIGILSFKPDVPLSFAIKHQNTWKSTNSNKPLTNIFFSIIKGLGYLEAFNVLDDVVSKLEVNWSYIFIFLSSLLLSDPNAAGKLKEMIETYLCKGCNSPQPEYLVLGFLFARHASLEGRHIFPSYSHWFATIFGSEKSTPANNKQSFLALFNFLTGLVPYETAPFLRTHINQSIFMPKGCQNILRDYQHLARTRLEEVSESVLMPNLGGKNPSLSMQQQSILEEEVESAISFFEEMGKVSSFVLEASIFRRPYYLSSFLPSLLTPRHLPDLPDSRMKFVDKLQSLQKIPPLIYKSYLEECQKLASRKEPGVEKMDCSVAPGPFASLDEYLQTFVELKESSTEAFQILSHLTDCIERLTEKSNEELKDASSLIIHPRQRDPSSIVDQVVTRILDTIKRVASDVECPLSLERASELVTLLATTPSLQKAMVTTLLDNLSSLRKIQAKGDEFQFLAVILNGMKHRSDLFLPMRLSTMTQSKLVFPADLLLADLVITDQRDLYFTCRLLTAVLEVSSKMEVQDPKSFETSKFKDVYQLYTYVAARLCLVTSVELEDILLYPVPPQDFSRLPFLFETKVPMCCRLLIDTLEKLKMAPFDEWLKFELETPWGGTPLDRRLLHLRFWFMFHCKLPHNDSSVEYRSDEEFWQLFWTLVNTGTRKGNASDLFILLQSLSFEGLESSSSLLGEWQKWRTSQFKQNSEEDKIERISYYNSKLVVFLRLCHALPISLFAGCKPFPNTLNLFNKLIRDILVMKSEFFLDIIETRFLLERFLDSCERASPSLTHVRDCFSSLNYSVLFQFSAVKSICSKFDTVIQKYSCLRYLKMETEQELLQSQSLSNWSWGILASALLNRDEDVDLDSGLSSEQNFTPFVLCSISLLGLTLIKKIGESDEDPLWPALVTANATGSETTLLSLFDRFIRSQVEPLEVMSNWKSKVMSIFSQITWRAFLIGFIYVLLVKLESQKASRKISQHIPRFLSFLLVSFNILAKFFEKDPDKKPPSVSHLSSLVCRIYAIIDKMSDEQKQLIPDSVLRVCDQDILASIRVKRERISAI